MAPAAKASSQGMRGCTLPADAATRMPNTGSTAPEAAPLRKARHRLNPACRKGREMAAPSGKFWMPMPRARAQAAERAPGSPCWAARAKASPTAMPSGMLCRVTASTSRVVRRQPEGSPSGSCSFRCRWGSSRSRASMKAIPTTKPPAAGCHPGTPAASASSMAGSSRLNTDAATITPAAKPRNTRCSPACTDPRKKNTVPAPRAVMRKVKPVPPAAHRTPCMIVASSGPVWALFRMQEKRSG